MASLAEKYRPKTLQEVVGQEKAVKVLSRLDPGGRAFYITGKSGTGKTTLAKIIAGNVTTEQCTREVVARHLKPSDLQDWYYRAIQGGSILGEGWALIVNESHGLTKPVIELMLDVLENLKPWMVVVFTTTNDGKAVFDEQMDAEPFLSRCHEIRLEMRNIARPIAERVKWIAEREGLDGKPIEEYMKLATARYHDKPSCHCNMRKMLDRVEEGEMLD